MARNRTIAGVGELSAGWLKTDDGRFKGRAIFRPDGRAEEVWDSPAFFETEHEAERWAMDEVNRRYPLPPVN